MRPGDDVELVVGAEDHVLPFGEGGQANIGDRGVEGGLVVVDFAFVGQHEVATAYVKATVASWDVLLGDANKGQCGVWWGHVSCDESGRDMRVKVNGKDMDMDMDGVPWLSSSQRSRSVLTSRPFAPER